MISDLLFSNALDMHMSGRITTTQTSFDEELLAWWYVTYPPVQAQDPSPPTAKFTPPLVGNLGRD